MEIFLFDKNVEKFVGSLQKPVIAKVLRIIDLLEEFGYKLGLPHSKKISSNLFELRAHGAQEVRIFYTFFRGSIILLYGFVKKSTRIPGKEIEVALQKLRSLALK